MLWHTPPPVVTVVVRVVFVAAGAGELPPLGLQLRRLCAAGHWYHWLRCWSLVSLAPAWNGTAVAAVGAYITSLPVVMRLAFVSRRLA
jgi:hypothetical protein